MITIKSASVRRILRVAVPFVLIPAAVVLGIVVFDEKRYAFISLAVTLLALLLFVAGFERRQTGTRRLILVAVMVALSVVGRFIPFFKPITALTVLTALYFGGETGFLVGSLSAVISNFYFGQGPWTPFQMFAWGMIGLIAGALSTPLKKNRLLLLGYGALSGIVYSMVMDIWTVLWYNNSLDWSLYLGAMSAAAPYAILYAVSNVLFLALFAKPFGEKFERIVRKYGV